ncbi:MAG: hypothetical protein ACI9VR_004175 [Cognaticolwellia sp.]|jgi:hypothetical protein
MRRLPILTALFVVPNLAFAEALCKGSVNLSPADPKMADTLAQIGVSTQPQDDCAPLQVSTASLGQDLAVTITLPWGESEVREMPSHQAAAGWIDSWLARERLGELLDTNPAPSEKVMLYASFDDWRADRPSGESEADVIQSTSNAMVRVQDGLDPFYTLDLSIGQARDLGRVYAFKVGEQVYLNTGSPKPNRLASYGRVTEVSHYGIVQDEICVWVPPTQALPGYMTCDGFVRVIDLDTGDSESVGKIKLKRWMEHDPSLRVEWTEESRRNDGTVHSYLVELLTRQPDAALD